MSIDLRLVVPAVAAWIAAGVIVALPNLAIPVAIGLWVLATAGIAVAASARRGGAVVIVAVCCIAAALVCTVAAARSQQRQPDEIVAAADSGRYVTAIVSVTGPVVDGAERWPAVMTAVTIGGETHVLSSPVLVFGQAPAGGAGIGATLRVSGTLAANSPEDDTAFLLFAGSAAVAGRPPWLLEWANAVRARFADAAAALPGDGGDLLPGLAIGDTSAIGDTLDADMKASSLSHLTAVSGANCAVVVGLVMMAGAALGIGRAWRVAASVTVLVGFVVLVTPGASVLRAAIMAAIVLVALSGGRPVRGVPVLALATLSLLVGDPWLSRDYGCALSVLATGGLLVLAGPLARVMGRVLPLPLAAIVSVPLAAQLACQPVLILLNASIPVYGVVANILAEPAAPVATVLGLAACMLLPILPGPGMLLADIAWLPSSWIAAVATYVSALPAGQLPWPAGVPGLALLATVSALLLFGVFGGALPRLRRAAVALLLLVVVGLGGGAAGGKISRELSRPSDWQLAVCDIGQGDATLVRSVGLVALVDAGPRPERLTRCLDELGITHIDLLVLSHFDLDHVGGVSAVFGMVDRALVGPSGEAADDRLVARLAQSGAEVERASLGLSGLLGELRWSVLWPRAQLHGVQPGNDASIGMTFLPVGTCADGCLSSLFLADLGERPQALMLAAGPVQHVDVVKVSHHGSGDQNARTYEKALATVGVIGVGVDNGYGHPNDRLLDMLSAVGTAALRTDLDGLILLSPGAEPGSVSAWTERSGDGAPD